MEECFTDFSKWICEFYEVLNLNMLFLKLNRFISNYRSILLVYYRVDYYGVLKAN